MLSWVFVKLAFWFGSGGGFWVERFPRSMGHRHGWDVTRGGAAAASEARPLDIQAGPVPSASPRGTCAPGERRPARDCDGADNSFTIFDAEWRPKMGG